ncbi:hypothetical protein GEMRC1_003304 [Eukaryota sp. GEM-RC1]
MLSVSLVLPSVSIVEVSHVESFLSQIGSCLDPHPHQKYSFIFPGHSKYNLKIDDFFDLLISHSSFVEPSDCNVDVLSEELRHHSQATFSDFIWLLTDSFLDFLATSPSLLHIVKSFTIASHFIYVGNQRQLDTLPELLQCPPSSISSPSSSSSVLCSILGDKIWRGDLVDSNQKCIVQGLSVSCSGFKPPSVYSRELVFCGHCEVTDDVTDCLFTANASFSCNLSSTSPFLSNLFSKATEQSCLFMFRFSSFKEVPVLYPPLIVFPNNQCCLFVHFPFSLRFNLSDLSMCIFEQGHLVSREVRPPSITPKFDCPPSPMRRRSISPSERSRSLSSIGRAHVESMFHRIDQRIRDQNCDVIRLLKAIDQVKGFTQSEIDLIFKKL